MNLEAIEKFDMLAIQYAKMAEVSLAPHFSGGGARANNTEWQHRDAQAHAQTSLAYSAIVANLTAFRFGQGPGA